MINIINLACAALLAATMSAPASAQLMNFRRTKRHRHARLQRRDDRRAQMRKLVDAMLSPSDPVPEPVATLAPVPRPTTLKPTPTRPTTTTPLTASPNTRRQRQLNPQLLHPRPLNRCLQSFLRLSPPCLSLPQHLTTQQRSRRESR
jgi:hypothetical protein